MESRVQEGPRASVRTDEQVRGRRSFGKESTEEEEDRLGGTRKLRVDSQDTIPRVSCRHVRRVIVDIMT